MGFPICERVEKTWCDGVEGAGEGLPDPVFYSLRLHQINAFAYREAWAEELLKYVKFNAQGQPFFPASPATPEAHRHKFLCALTLSPGSPGAWERHRNHFQSSDFVSNILASPIADWADYSMAPDPSWTLQYLSAHLDERGQWQGRSTPFAEVAAENCAAYFRDFENGALWEPGKTPFTESGLHFLEALNKLSLRQAELGIGPLATFKSHVMARLQRSAEEVQVLLANRDWPQYESRQEVLEFSISQLLVLGHLLEVCFHPQGALLATWEKAERDFLEKAAIALASLMEFFFDPKVLALMDAEQKRAYPFPMLHAYSALKKLELA